MASGPITSWQIDGKQWKQWQMLFSWAPKPLQMVTAAMKLMLAPWKESYGKPRQHIKKQRHYFADKGPSSQSYGSSSSHIQIWELDHKESLVPKNWCFWLWCWKRLFRVPWTARSNQSILKEFSPEYSLEGLILKLQYFGYLMWRADKLEKTLMLGRTEGERRKGWQSMRWLDSITDSVESESCSVMSDFLDFTVCGILQARILEWVASRGSSQPKDWTQVSCVASRFFTSWAMKEAYSLTQRTWIWASSRSWWWTGRPGVLQSMGSQRVGYNWGTEQQKALKYSFKFCCDVKIHM